MKILVTGGLGFIGTHLINSLDRNEFEISILDNGEPSNLFKSNNTTIIKADIQDYESIKSLTHEFDTVIHLAAKISVSESIIHPDIVHNVNVTGTLNLLRSCVKNNVKNFIAASSASVYGASLEQPLTEKSSTIPISMYGSSKLAMEHYIQAFSYSYGINALSLRFFNIYGEGQSFEYGGIITKFIDMIKNDQTLKIFGDGKSTRDFVSIHDVIDSIKNSLSHIHGKRGTAYNISSGTSTSILELIQLMKNISKKELSVLFLEPKTGDIEHSSCSIKLANQELGYFPKIKLKQGLEQLMKIST